MMKYIVLKFFILFALNAFAEEPCDVRPGYSIGIKVVEFTSGNTIHSKIPFKETTADTLLEEMINLQDMGICEEKISAQKCILKYEKNQRTNSISFYRAGFKWNSWGLKSKDKAQSFVNSLKRVGFCS
jgi:hypothetical protein